MGEIYDMELNLVRDIQKWSNSRNDMNLYQYWLDSKKYSTAEGEKFEILSVFIDYC